MRITTKRSLLAVAIGLLSSPMYALELLSDDMLSDVTAQDGVSFHSIASEIKMDKVYWQDGTGVNDRELQMRDIKLTNWDATMELDLGSNNGLVSATPAISLHVLAKPFLLTVGGIGVCAIGATCTSTFGEFAFETQNAANDSKDSEFSFFNTNSFFDGSSSNGRFRFFIDRASVYFAQTNSSGIRSLGILQNFTLNGSLNGKFTIDADEGIRTQGTLSFNRNNATRTHGMQFDIAHKGNVPTGFTTVGASPITRFGISGNILNFDWSIKADNSLVTAPIANTQGIKMMMSGVLDKNNFQMEVGYPTTYSIVFKNWVDFADGAAVNPSSPDVTFGELYFNTIASTGTLPNFTTGYGTGFGQVTALDDAVGLAVRGLNFQAYPRQLVFQDNNSPYTQSPQNWSLISALYNLDANVLLYSGGHPSLGAAKRGIGFDLSMATTGRDATGKEGTHILVADPEAGTYLGFRNLDAKVQLNKGQFYITDSATDGINGFKVTSKDMKFDLSGEFAVGKLPNGSSVKYVGSNSSGTRIHDEMFGLRVRMEGELNVAVAPPPEGGYAPVLTIPVLNIFVGLGVNGSLTVVDPTPTWHSTSMAQAVLPDPQGLRNSIVITEPVDGTEIQFADLNGVLTIRPEHIKQGEFPDRPTIIGHSTADYTDVSRVEVGNNEAVFAVAFQFGNRSGTGAHDPNDVFRIGDVALGFENDNNPLTAIPEANRYRLGEIVFTGGRLYAQINIKPQL